MNKRWKIIILVLVAVVGTLWILRASVAERAVIAALQQKQIPVQSLQVEMLTKNHIVLRDMVLGNSGEVKVAHADIVLDWHGANVAAITMDIKQADITVTMGSYGLKIGGIEQAWQAKNAAPNAAAKLSPETQIKFSGDVKINYAMLGKIQIELLQDEFQISQQQRAMLLPLIVNGIIEGDLTKTITVKTTFASAKNELRGEMNGSYQPVEKSGKFTWKTQAIDFAVDGITFAQLAPTVAAEMKTFPMQAASSGTIILSKDHWVVTPTITLVKMPLANVLASALGEGTTVDGIIGGAVPLRVTPQGWTIQPARMNNIGGLHIAVQPGSASAAALSSHPQANIVQAALANFQVEKMTLDLSSTDNQGGVVMQWHFLGHNPDLLGGKKVDFTLAVNANLEDMLKATASAQSLVQQAKNPTPREAK